MDHIGVSSTITNVQTTHKIKIKQFKIFVFYENFFFGIGIPYKGQRLKKADYKLRKRRKQ